MEGRVRPLRAAYAAPDEELAAWFLATAGTSPEAEKRIDARAGALVAAIRARAAGGVGGIEDFLHEYSLSTKEGLALMVLAESLLRVPDSATADRLIEDKLSAGDFAAHEVRSPALLVSASAWALGISARVVGSHETPESILHEIVGRLGRPAVRTATRQAMRLIGSHFVLGQTISEALARGGAHPEFRYSFDMLGEGARTAHDAERYFRAYADAIAAIGAAAGASALPQRPGISVKLSALHPRYEAVSRDRVMAELTPRVIELARAAKAHDLNLTIDAEEADRLELSLDVIGRTLSNSSLAGWDGFGLAVQAYQKRAPAVIDWVAETAEALGRRVMVRLVKGAYWDTEVKRAQERGLLDYPVFSRKAMTDLCYMDCAKKLLAARPRLYPQIATHNALTVASVIEAAGGVTGYEFQRLYGMGDALYESLLRDMPGAACRVYAPVGGHRDLLAYLVRRLLENGANSSFVYAAADPNVPVAQILERPGGGDRHAGPRPAPEDSAAAGPLRAEPAQFVGRRVRRLRRPRAIARRCARRRARERRGGAARRRHRHSRTRARGALADRRRGDRRRHRRRRGDRHACDDRGRRGFCRLGRDAARGAQRGADARRRCAREEPRAPDRAPAGGGRQDPRRCRLRGARGRRLLPLLRG